jgi:hypothetical protein
MHAHSQRSSKEGQIIEGIYEVQGLLHLYVIAGENTASVAYAASPTFD